MSMCPDSLGSAAAEHGQPAAAIDEGSPQSSTSGAVQPAAPLPQPLAPAQPQPQPAAFPESENVSKTAQRIVAAVGQLQKTAATDTPQEQMEAFCAMMRSIREGPDECELAEADPVAYMGKYVNDQARCGDPVHLCALIKKLRAVDTADISTIRAFYAGMIEHAKGRKRLSVDLPAEEASPDAKLPFLRMLEGETRAKVSACAADDLQRYVMLLEAKVELVTALSKTK